MTDTGAKIQLRPMVASDIGRYPIGCQGDENQVRARIEDLGSSAILAFDGSQHVGQLQFRRYDRDLRSPDGIMNPDYWGDFGDDAPDPGPNVLSIFCYHVGQTDESDDRDARYFGRGIGLELLDYFLVWAEENGYAAVTAKATPAARSVMTFMGGQPASVYVERGFEVANVWSEDQLRKVVLEQGLVEEGGDHSEAFEVSCCIKHFANRS